MRNWSGVNAAASMLPRTSPRYANSSSRVFGNPPASSSGVSMSSRRNLRRGRPLQRDDLEVLVVRHGLAQELHLGPRLTLDVQNPFAPVIHRRSAPGGRCSRVTCSPACTGTRTVRTRGPASASVNRTRAVAGLAVGRQRHVLRRDGRPSSSTTSGTVWPSKPDWLTITSTTSVAPLSTVRAKVDAADLDVTLEPLFAEADGEHRQAGGREAAQRSVGRRQSRGVGAVGHQHDPRRGQAGEFLGRALQGGADVVTACPSNVAASGSATRVGRRRKTEEPQAELASRAPLRSVPDGDEGIADERAARLPRRVGNRQAA